MLDPSAWRQTLSRLLAGLVGLCLALIVALTTSWPHGKWSTVVVGVMAAAITIVSLAVVGVFVLRAIDRDQKIRRLIG